MSTAQTDAYAVLNLANLGTNPNKSVISLGFSVGSTHLTKMLDTDTTNCSDIREHNPGKETM